VEAAELAPGFRAAPRRCVKLHGLPFRTRASEVLEFFDGFKLIREDIRFLTDHGMDAHHGQAFVRFESEAEAKRARQMLHHKYIGSRYIELFEVPTTVGLDTKDARLFFPTAEGASLTVACLQQHLLSHFHLMLLPAPRKATAPRATEKGPGKRGEDWGVLRGIRGATDKHESSQRRHTVDDRRSADRKPRSAPRPRTQSPASPRARPVVRPPEIKEAPRRGGGSDAPTPRDVSRGTGFGGHPPPSRQAVDSWAMDADAPSPDARSRSTPQRPPSSHPPPSTTAYL